VSGRERQRGRAEEGAGRSRAAGGREERGSFVACTYVHITKNCLLVPARGTRQGKRAREMKGRRCGERGGKRKGGERSRDGGREGSVHARKEDIG